MKRKQLIKTCEELFTEFNPIIQTFDSFIHDTLGDCDSPEAPPDNIFIKQCLFSVVRYERGLKSFLKHFFFDNAASVLRTDYTMYMIMLTLGLFRIEELGMEEFTKFCHAQDPTKMSQFLQYTFDDADDSPVQAAIKADWCKDYDVKYVEDTLIGTITSFMGDMNSLAASLEAKALGLVAAKEKAKEAAGIPQMATKKLTVPVEPKITKPRPRRVPEPMKITNDVKVGPEPEYLYRTSLEEINKEKEKKLLEVRERTVRKYTECKEQPFNFHETRSNIEKVRQEVEQKRNSELQFESSHRKPLPDFTKRNAVVKLNAAAILREDALFKKKQAEEAKLIQNYEEELRDSTEFYRWRDDMEKHDDKMKLEQVKLKRMQAVQSSQNARDALDRQFNDNKAIADIIKEEAELMGNQRVLEEEARVMVGRQLVQEVREVEEKAPRKAEAKVFRDRQQVRKSQKENLAAAWEKKVEEDLYEKERKMDRIRQLRTHTVHKPEVKVFDPTTSAGLGLLNEMSLVEMEERLEINKNREETVVNEKRQAIVTNRAKKQEQLAQRISNIQRIREAARDSNRSARVQQKQKETEDKIRENEALERSQVILSKKLMEEREERKQKMIDLLDEEERRKKNQQFQGAATHQVEETHFDQLLLGNERAAKMRQEKAQSAAFVYEKTKITARKVVEKEAKKKQRDKAVLYAQKDLEILDKRQDLLVKNKAEVAQKKFAFSKSRMKEHEIKAKLIDRNPYAQTINNMSLTLAKTAKEDAYKSKSNVVSMLTS